MRSGAQGLGERPGARRGQPCPNSINPIGIMLACVSARVSAMTVIHQNRFPDRLGSDFDRHSINVRGSLPSTAPSDPETVRFIVVLFERHTSWTKICFSPICSTTTIIKRRKPHANDTLLPHKNQGTHWYNRGLTRLTLDTLKVAKLHLPPSLSGQ